MTHQKKKTSAFEIIIENPEKCLRYAGLTLSQVQVAPSPYWLQNRLKSIGIALINNVVDVTNFVMHELGTPLHAFDSDQIEGGQIQVKTLTKGTPFETLDHIHRKLDAEDLMICDAKKPLCIAGVLGGVNSSITSETQNIFLESAYFHPVTIRQISKRHGINTEASFRFERGVDPDQTVYALQRAALLLEELTGFRYVSKIIDIYPQPINPFEVTLYYKKMNLLLGEEISSRTVKEILSLLEIKILSETEESLKLSVPPYRVDVQREVDIIEEILRIYGYNRIQIPERMSLSIKSGPSRQERVEENTARQLVAHGFYETIHLSLDKADRQEPAQNTVKIINPLSQDLALLRTDLLHGILECVAYNINRKNTELKLFEWGKTYHKKDRGFSEKKRLVLVTTSKKGNETSTKHPFLYIKGIVEQLLQAAGIIDPKQVPTQHPILGNSLTIRYQNQNLVELGQVKIEFAKDLDINQKIFFSDIDWEFYSKIFGQNKIHFKPLPRYPGSKRDLALLLDEEVLFEDLYRLAKATEKLRIKDIRLFDVYEGDLLPKGKKSYALSFYLEDETQTLTDEIIDRTMEKIQRAFEEKLGAQLRYPLSY
ncbi:MAG: phenylalanine--tRNA ligase subunit beta [Flavobacteriales bacterium Tduv]